MKYRHIVYGLILVLLIALAMLLWPSSSAQRESNENSGNNSSLKATKSQDSEQKGAFQETLNENTIDKEDKKEAVIGKIISALSTPITFYGKVVDQDGNPVPNALVRYSLLDKFNASGSGGGTSTDKFGNIEISGVRGAVLGVNVSKNGYYQIHDVSNQRFAYGIGPDTYTKSPPTIENPAIFVLQGMGNAEPLAMVSSRQINVPKTGNPVSIDLANGRTGNGDLQVTSWIGNSNQRPFDWSYKLNVPGGGLIERKGQFDFEAPPDGYQSTIEVGMAANAQQWTSQLTKEYFAKLADGRHARFSIEFYAGKRLFVVLESYVNPARGSRNLEYDPAKRTNP